MERFLQEQPAGAIGLDVGCGNGKYLTVNRDIFIVGSDRFETSWCVSTRTMETNNGRSPNLIDIASQHQPHAVIVADTLSLPHPNATFDFAISIAVIHHLSTPARRIAAVHSILDSLKSRDSTSGCGGQALIYVWALEQKDSRRGWDAGHAQDVMVPWVMKTGAKTTPKKRRQKGGVEPADAPNDQVPQQDQTFHRYYHLYREGELENNILEAGGIVVESGYERDNWWAIASPGFIR